MKRPKKAKQGKARVKGAVKRPRGRPTKRTPTVESRILDGLAAGTPLTILCEPLDMPDPATVWRWADSDAAFSQAIARARDAGFDRIALEALRIADTPLEGATITEKPDGKEVKRADMLGHRKLQVETRLKLLAKWDPKRYGERLAQEISGPNGGPIETETRERDADAEARFACLLAEADAKARPATE